MVFTLLTQFLVIELNYTLIIALLIFSAMVSIVLCVYIYEKSRAGKVMNFFIFGVICTILWTVLYMFELLAPNNSIHWFVICLEYIPLTLVGFFFMHFAFLYTKHTMMSKKMIYITLSLPLIGYITVITNPIHHLVYREIAKGKEVLGPLCFAIIFMTIGYLGIGAMQFLNKDYLKTISRRKQGMYFIIGMSLPSIVHILSELKIINFGFRVTLIVIPFSVLLFIVAVLKYQFLDVLPIAINDTIDSMYDGMLVFNCEGKIIDYNTNFFYKFFGIKNMKSIQSIDFFYKETEHLYIDKNEFLPIFNSIHEIEADGIKGKIELKHRFKKITLFYTSQPLYNYSNTKIATLMTLFDMSEIYRLCDEVEIKNSELIEANNKLNAHIEIVQKLTVEAERNKIMTEIHDTLGQSMMELLTLLELIVLMMNQENSKVMEIIQSAIDKGRMSLQDVRAAVMNYKKIGGVD